AVNAASPAMRAPGPAPSRRVATSASNVRSGAVRAPANSSTPSIERASMTPSPLIENASNDEPGIALVEDHTVRPGQPAVRRGRHMAQRHRVVDIAADRRDLAGRDLDDDVAMAGEALRRQVLEADALGPAPALADQIARLRCVEIGPLGPQAGPRDRAERGLAGGVDVDGLRRGIG